MTRRFIFADTSALYPLFAPKDYLKQVCIDILKELLEDYRASLITTNWVQYECLSKLKKYGISYCEKFEELITREVLHVTKVNAELENSGLQFFWNYRDKTWSIVDCVSIAFMFENNIYYSFAKDDHFRQAGLFPLLKMDCNNNPTKSYISLMFV